MKYVLVMVVLLFPACGYADHTACGLWSESIPVEDLQRNEDLIIPVFDVVYGKNTCAAVESTRVEYAARLTQTYYIGESYTSVTAPGLIKLFTHNAANHDVALAHEMAHVCDAHIRGLVTYHHEGWVPLGIAAAVSELETRTDL